MLRRITAGLTKLTMSAVAVAVTVLAALPAGTAAAAAGPTPHQTAAKPASLGRGAGLAPSAITASSADLCAQVAYKAGFPYNANVAGHPIIVVAISVAMAESGCNPSAAGHNGPTSGCPNGSTDRGLWQVNDCYHSGVSNACAYNAMCNAIAAYQISNGGTNWNPWSTYSQNKWQAYVSTAEGAISRLTVTMYNRNTNRCLGADSANTSNGAPVFQWACSSTNPYEQWHVLVVNDGLQVLKNVGTGTCLDGDGSASGNGKPVFQWSCSADTSSFEDWIVGGSGALSDDANATLYNWGDRTCLANDSAHVGDGGTIFQWTCNRSNGWMLWT